MVSTAQAQSSFKEELLRNARLAEPIEQAVVIGLTREGEIVFLHDGPMGILHLPIVAVSSEIELPEVDTEEVTLSASTTVVNDAYLEYKALTNFSTGEFGLLEDVRAHRRRTWIVVITGMGKPEHLPDNVHLVPFADFWMARSRMEAQDPVLSAAGEILIQELQRRDIIDEFGTLVPYRW